MKTSGILIIPINRTGEMLLLKSSLIGKEWGFIQGDIVQNEGEYQTASKEMLLALGLENNVDHLFCTRSYYTYEDEKEKKVNKLLIFLLKCPKTVTVNKEMYPQSLWVTGESVLDYITDSKLKKKLYELMPLVKSFLSPRSK